MPTDEPVPPEFLRVMAGRFATLGDPTRLAILHCLVRHGERNITHIVRATKQSHPNVSNTCGTCERPGWWRGGGTASRSSKHTAGVGCNFPRP